ncbi:MAG TPA: hypothetical protein VI911_07885 [Patescibacteria group bacterium]|nr:hypothetical protein [Patescibacteria group bacterium]
MSIRRGWEVELQDGTTINEKQSSWASIPKTQIKCLSLHYDGRSWHLENKEAYFINTRASMVPGNQASFQVEQRTIGFYEGATKVHYTIDEFTGKFNVKVVNG